ncbi:MULTISPECIES: L-lactate dehydrogenase [unclassified Motilimonas]|uniref:L-lactate dehydrogenase n=1 Tax=Motilimonas TaxID=1914248 RepID=UPI001E34FE7D|nr:MULTISPECIES: L-lactate dehydrogenase [unclassified Motilimonas]MCE0558215.1 L-lactate dehydrogenase [Motilimonas sp. E26]MDO6526395.1 L-lactate dehydrogenase [Motilimonas sp. 1_MG-2023]
MKTKSVGIVGAGNVGVAGAYAIYLQQLCSEIILVDLDKARAEGEALDLMHGQGITGRVKVKAGDYADLVDCDVIIVTAGAAQKPGETRLDLLNKNAAIFKSITAELDHYAPNAIVVIASNPVDILTYIFQELSSRPNSKVIGTGTVLDTSRLKSLLSEHYDVDPASIHGYILGEHGDSEFAAWSTITIGGVPVVGNEVLGIPYSQQNIDQLYEQVKSAAYKIIAAKGYTNWAIGVVLAKLVSVLMSDRASVQPISVRLTGEYGIKDVCISVPAKIGIKGVEQIVELNLSKDELKKLRISADVLRDNLAGIDLA